MADQGNITIYMQGLRAAAWGDRHQPPRVEAAAAGGGQATGTGFTVQQRKQQGSCEAVHTDDAIAAMQTSREAFLASVCRQVVTTGFEPIPDVFKLPSW